jgi:hypothetical protein
MGLSEDIFFGMRIKRTGGRAGSKSSDLAQGLKVGPEKGIIENRKIGSLQNGD